MSTWLDNFLLGRPGSELAFDLNPNQVRVDNSQIVAKNRVLSGKLRKWVFRTEFPTISIDGRFMTMDQKDLFDSLLAITDTMLSFRVRTGGFTRTGEKNSSSNGGTTVVIQENSATLLSAALIFVGSASSVVITGVFDNKNLTGTNYYTGGSYADASRTITLGTPLPTSDPCYVTYTYTGWLVNMERLSWQAIGGHVDVTDYQGWTLEGV